MTGRQWTQWTGVGFSVVSGAALALWGKFPFFAWATLSIGLAMIIFPYVTHGWIFLRGRYKLVWPITRRGATGSAQTAQRPTGLTASEENQLHRPHSTPITPRAPGQSPRHWRTCPHDWRTRTKAQVVLPAPQIEGRIFIDRHPIDFINEIEEMEHSDDAQVAAKKYVGKWQVLEGPFRDREQGEDWIHVSIETDVPLRGVFADFYKGWLPHLEHLSKGDSVKFIGKIQNIHEGCIFYSECDPYPVPVFSTARRPE